MSAFAVRTGGTEDVDAVARLHIAAWVETYTGLLPDGVLQEISVAERTALWQRVLADSRSAVLVAECAGALAGFSACGPQRSEALAQQGYDGEITAIYVLRRFQRRGIGRALMAAASEALGMRSFNAAGLWVLDRNEQARRFYQRRGGVVVGTRTDSVGGVVVGEVAYGWRDLEALRASG